MNARGIFAVALVAVPACATSGSLPVTPGDGDTSASASARSSADTATLQQPVAAVAGHIQRQATAVDTLQQAFADCDRAMGDDQLLPSGFFGLQQKYAEGRDQALLQDSTLRESSAQWKPDNAVTGTSYEDWIIRCDFYFKTNAPAFEAAREVEEAARRKKAREEAAAAQPELKERIVSSDDAPHEVDPTQRHLIRFCQVDEGKIIHCGEPYTGKAPAFKDGVWRSCTITDGQVVDCGDPLEGSGIVKESGLIRSCDVVEGVPVACTDGWMGYAPLQSPR
jgi:hypothetical protein